MKTKDHSISILSAINYLIEKQRLEPKQIQKLIKRSIMEAKEKRKKILR